MRLAFFQVLEARVEDFFDAVEFRTPKVLHLLKADVQVQTKATQACIVHRNSDQYGDGGGNRSNAMVNS